MDIKKNDIVYYARAFQSLGIYEIYELKVITVKDDYYVGVEKKDKHSYLFYKKDLGKTIFLDRNEALAYVHKKEENKKLVSDEVYYEEY